MILYARDIWGVRSPSEWSTMKTPHFLGTALTTLFSIGVQITWNGITALLKQIGIPTSA